MKTGICPYPGLRPFTEEESIFFKGRDLHIRQIVKLLEQNKMAFITGASGDGKSSMVYAGVVPYIRAGFSKAEFNSWLIFDFKPQRNPLASLAQSVADEMQLSYSDTLEQMRLGFSALVKMYKKSPYYVNDGSDDAKNRGKNLLIIADQFEEVFTMNENFHNGTPSNDSYTCVNILLETVRLSITEQLPIYVIFTMRSDYISQCTVFKDLPEFIAYSQFFVPQLKRTEIHQVIEEPALLAGGSVSTRLTEVLINNLNSGFDQLPVLQHALNLLWKTADNGAVPLDLLHLAKIAGISREMLGSDERKEFDSWYATLPYYQKKYYEHPDLNNVLNAHAGTLYESAYDYFMHNANWAEKSITPEESKQIIEIAFKSLTKIDDNRQVRNRCSIHEIKGIINKPNITEATVCGVLNIFRAEENTLLRPFAINDRLETQYLSGDTVLDVTHEALIRNWRLLTQWDYEELDNIKEYNDFNSQVQRWIDNGRSPEFLLSSGNYALFSQWYDRCRPNKYWLLKNDTSQRTEREKLRAAEGHIDQCNAFMERSNEAIVAKEKSHRRKVLIAIGALLVFIAGLSIFSLWAVSEKEEADIARDNAEQQKTIAEERTTFAEQQQRKAEEQQRRAVEANEIAERQRDTARVMYERAMAAKVESDIARRQAEEAQEAAQRSEKRALDNAAEAKRQSQAAERERQNVLDQMKLTKAADSKAARLYYVALCNTLAMKAKNQYEDKTLNLRLAKTACEMNQKGGGDTLKNADLYDAMLFAMEQNHIINPLEIQGSPFKSFAIAPDGHIVTIAANGNIARHSIVPNGSAKLVDNVDSYAHKAPVESAVFITPTLALCSNKDRTSYLIDLAANRQTKLPSNNEYIKSGSISPDHSKCAVAYFYGNMMVIPTDGGNKPLAEKDFSTVISDVYYHSNDNIYVLCHDGSLLKWNVNTNDTKTILAPDTRHIAFKMTAIPDKQLLAVCYSDGEIQFVDLRTDRKSSNMAGGHSKIENLLYDQNTGILALSSADKRISLINTNNLEEKPLVIEEHSLDNRKVKCMGFNGNGILFALTDDNKLRFWDTDPKTYTEALSSMNLPPLSDSEWNLIVGREFSEK
ncbi:MAG: hypothetical protein II852_13610 [Bacteroidales bacterium]|nr:hypothetical protein [Bacteroidales bacterium]